MDTSTSTKTKPTNVPRDAAQAFRETAENGVANAKAAFEKTNAVAAEATTMMKDSYAKSVKGAQDYQMKAIEFARTNTEAAFEFAQKLTTVKSPSEFFELSTNHSRKQFETLTEQAKELTTLAQQVAMASAEPIKSGAARAFSQIA